MIRTTLAIAFAIATIFLSPSAHAAFKCATKDGVTYQDKPCEGPPQKAGPVAVGSAAVAARGDPRQEEQLAADRDWAERSSRKARAVHDCVKGLACSVAVLRTSALYLTELQLEEALGAPWQREMLGVSRTSRWLVRFAADNGEKKTVKLTAAWGLCSDEKSYFAAGSGPRACLISVE